MTLIQKEPQSIKICVEKSLCFTANTAGSTVRLNKFNSPTNTNFETSTDGITWSDYTVSTRITLTNVGDKVYFRNKYSTTSFSIDYNNYYYFQMTGSIAASGDVTSLLDKNFRTSTSASDLFRSLFKDCASLTTAPSLPLTTLSNNCYIGMFLNCTGLTTLPELPATTLTTNCYSSMFSGCTNIKLSTSQTGDYQTAYKIPSSGTGTTGTNSLNGMFSSTGGSWTGTPTINTTYYTSNTVVPATTSPVKDVQKVYIGSTQVRPVLPPPTELCFTANTANSTVQLTKTGTPTAVNLETSTDGGNWSSYTIGDAITLSNVGDKVYFRNTSTTDTGFSDISSNYKFSMNGSISASGDITTLLNKNGTDTVSSYCFMNLFRNCTSLTTPPSLPATTLADGCYTGMFYDCTSLTTAPELPATTLAEYCYNWMFRGCTSLTTVPSLQFTTTADSCCYGMFYGCTSLNTLPSLPATTISQYSYSYMFYGCTNIMLNTYESWKYYIPYRIPSSGTGPAGTDWSANMFTNTGGGFTGTPNLNTTYYTSNTVV